MNTSEKFACLKTLIDEHGIRNVLQCLESFCGEESNKALCKNDIYRANRFNEASTIIHFAERKIMTLGL